MQVSGYLGTLEKSQKIILKISILEASARPKGGHRQPGGSQDGAWRGPAPSRATCPPGWVPHPLVTYLGPYLFSRRGNVERGVAFSIYAAEPPQPSVLLRRANLEAELASGEGEIIAIVIVITSPSPLHDSFSHV